MTDLKATLLLCLICATVTAGALEGLSSAATDSTFAALSRVVAHTSDRDEEPEARRKRLRALADAIDAATISPDERAWLIMTAIRESGLAEYVTEDHARCSEGHGGRCDGGRAFGAWQVHRMARTESKEMQAAMALRLFKAAAVRCARDGHDYWHGGIAGYARGLSCQWAEAKARVEHMRKVRATL